MKAMPNFTDVTGFILLGLTNHQELQVLFFVVFLVVYMISLIGNIGTIILISISPQLQSHMYFFLESFVFCGCVVLLQCHSEDAEKLTIRDKTDFLCGMFGAVLLLQSSCPHGSIYLGCDGL